jgi:hypothetical protein
MATEGLPDGVNIVVGDAELLACLADYGGDEWVMCLDDSGEEVVGGLVVQSSGEDVPEPTVSGVVLRRGHLHLRPLRECVCVCVCVGEGGYWCYFAHKVNSPVLVDHIVFWVRFRPLNLTDDVRGLEYERQPVAAYYLPYQIIQQLYRRRKLEWNRMLTLVHTSRPPLCIGQPSWSQCVRY